MHSFLRKTPWIYDQELVVRLQSRGFPTEMVVVILKKYHDLMADRLVAHAALQVPSYYKNTKQQKKAFQRVAVQVAHDRLDLLLIQ